MPEFVLDTFGAVANPPGPDIEFRDLDAFTGAYIEAAFFTETSCIPMVEWDTPESQERVAEGQADGSIPADAGFSDLHPQTLQSIIADCVKFQADHADTLAKAYEMTTDNGFAYTEARAGHDFWLTRCGHGAGFWDRGLGDVGQTLSDACGFRTEFGELNADFCQAADGAESPTGYGWVFIE